MFNNALYCNFGNIPLSIHAIFTCKLLKQPNVIYDPLKDTISIIFQMKVQC